MLITGAIISYDYVCSDQLWNQGTDSRINTWDGCAYTVQDQGTWCKNIWEWLVPAV